MVNIIPESTRRNTRASSVTGWIIALLAIGPLGVVAGLMIGGTPPPQGLEEPRPNASATAELQAFDDASSVRVEFLTQASVPITLDNRGVVTRIGEGGGTLRSGQLVCMINDRPVIALATQVPLYRDITPGSSGADVAALKTELTRLGFLADSPGDAFDDRGVAAWQDLQAAAHIATPRREVLMTETVWLPQEAVQANTWLPAVGARVPPDGVIAVVAGRIEAVILTSASGSLLPGPRTLELFGARTGIETPPALPFPVTTAGFLRELERNRDYQDHLASEPQDIYGTWRLTSPISTWRVPLGAVFGVSDSHGCVQSNGVSVPVEIVSTSLGATLVTTETGQELSSIDLGAAIEGNCQR